MERVIQNLLDNALKATRAGGTVGVRVMADGGGVALMVTDAPQDNEQE